MSGTDQTITVKACFVEICMTLSLDKQSELW